MSPLKLSVPAFTSGLILASAWLGFNGFFLFIAFIPLLYIDDFFHGNKHRYKPFVFWLFSLVTFLVWNGFTLWWIWNATPFGAIFTIIVNSFLMSLVWGLAHFVGRVKGKAFGHLFLFFAWISFEFLHYQWDMSCPWLTLGNGLANDIKIIQWFEYTGVFGGTAWILMVNLLSWNFINSWGQNSTKKRVSQVVVISFVVFFPLVLSIIRYQTYHENIDPVNIVIAQPNIDPYNEKFSRMSVEEQLRRLLQVSDSLGNDSTDFFVGPETALPDLWENNPFPNKQIVLLRQFLMEKYPDAAFVVGASTFRRYFPGEEIPNSARYSPDSSIVYDAFNSACFIEKELPVQFYHKTKLVSGVEKIPFQKQLKFLERWIINLGGISGTLGTQKDMLVFSKNAAKIAVPICYESGYGEYLSGFIKKGANILFIITNDGWWSNTPGYKQHLSYSRLRAIEFRRGIARSGNTGISCFINQRGDIVKQTGWWKKTAISGSVNLNNKITFYAKHGDYIARISVIMFVLMLIIFLIELVKSKEKLKNQ
jgi:apolipoprotein N-acyltransferase